MSSPPTKYIRAYDFVAFQAGAPSTPLPANKLQDELALIKTTTDVTIDRLGEIQRDDGKLANQSVGVDQLDASTYALLSGNINPRGDWLTATAYEVLDIVSVSGAIYICVTAHTSGTFNTDLAATKWMLFANPTAANNAAFFQQFSGTGSQTVFTLSSNQGTDPKNIFVFVGGAIRRPTIDYTLSGVTLTFTAAPASGTNNVLVFGAANAVASSVADAANSAAAAAASALDAAAQVTLATTQAGNAAGSATTATTQAGIATTQAGNAAASAAAAAASAASVPSLPLNPNAITFSATQRVLGRRTAGAGTGEEVSLTQFLDFVGSAAQGDILYRGASAWTRLAAGTSGNFLKTQGAGADPMWASAGAITYATPLATTSGTTKDFSSLPSGLRRIYVMLKGVSKNNTSRLTVQIGESGGGLKTSGYVGSSWTGGAFNAMSSGFDINDAASGAIVHGLMILQKYDGSNNIWACNSVMARTDSPFVLTSAGSVSLAGTLDRLRLTSTGGDTFTAGEVNIAYE